MAKMELLYQKMGELIGLVLGISVFVGFLGGFWYVSKKKK